MIPKSSQQIRALKLQIRVLDEGKEKVQGSLIGFIQSMRCKPSRQSIWLGSVLGPILSINRRVLFIMEEVEEAVNGAFSSRTHPHLVKTLMRDWDESNIEEIEDSIQRE